MEESIDICACCGKMPRRYEALEGLFRCSRCGGTSTISVNSDEYEKVASELDRSYHERLHKDKVQKASSFPLTHDEIYPAGMKGKSRSAAPLKKKAGLKPSAKKRTASKKSVSKVKIKARKKSPVKSARPPVRKKKPPLRKRS